jgi:predicted KAP-like P-loop ATPase
MMSSPAKKQKTAPKTSAERMRDYRKRMRQKGYVQKTIWTIDLNNPEVLADYQRQARELGKSDPAGDEIMPWIEAAMDWPDEEWPEYAENGK